MSSIDDYFEEQARQAKPARKFYQVRPKGGEPFTVVAESWRPARDKAKAQLGHTKFTMREIKSDEWQRPKKGDAPIFKNGGPNGTEDSFRKRINRHP